jgi:hypothetical protein
MTNEIRKEVDEMMEAYVDWHEACLVASDAYRSWSSATGLDASVAFGRYVTALDREELAAAIYAGLVRRVGRLVTSDQNPAGTLDAPAWRAIWR